MKKEKSYCHSPPEDALTRFMMVSKVLHHEHNGDSRPEAISKAAKERFLSPTGKMQCVCTRTLYRWLDAYGKHGFEGLMSAKRMKIEDSLVIPRPILDYFSRQKKDDPCVSIPELIKRAEELGMVAPGTKLNRITVWRSLNRIGVDTRRRKKPKDKRGRRFAYPHRMDMVICDGKHFRAGAARLKRVALFFLDDATRKGLNVVVGTSENTALFLRGLYETILTFGLMSSLFVDNGPGFKATDSILVLANLNVLFIHGTESYPEGHGKIEKFNQTAKNEILRYLDGNPDVDPSCKALELRLRHYLLERYDRNPHESLNAESPICRFQNDERPLRFHPSQDHLKRAFVLYKKRRVSKDNVVKINGGQYEVPFGHAGTWIMVHRNVLTDSLFIIHNGRKVNLSPVDLHTNAREKRFSSVHEEKPTGPLPKSSAQMAFERDLKPVIDSDGNFTDKKS